jgi:GTP-binding protein
MIVKTCQHQLSVADPGRLPRDGFPQVAFMGRSNVGKSSLINRLLGVRGIARTSKTPGRTREIHFYLVNDRLYFVDLPGYGYARVPRPMREEWRGLIESYLDGPLGPDLAVVLVDARHEPTDLDRELVEWLASRGTPARVVLTKIDKLSRGHRDPALRRASEGLGLLPDTPPLAASASTGDGLPALWRVIDDALPAGRRGRTLPGPVPQSAAASHTRTSRPRAGIPPQTPTRRRTRP